MYLVYQIKKLSNLIDYKIENITQRLEKLEHLQEGKPYVQIVVESITTDDCKVCYVPTPKYYTPLHTKPNDCNDSGMEMS